MTGAERAARQAVLREAAEELTTIVLDDVLPLAHRLRTEMARRLGLTMTELACLDTLRRFGPSTSDLLGFRTGLGRSAVSKMLRRLEQAGHVERTPNPDHQQGVLVRLVPNQLRDDQRELLRFALGAALTDAADGADLDRSHELTRIVVVLRTLVACLHRAATEAAVLRDARQRRAGKQW